jgi:hypothetical protein
MLLPREQSPWNCGYFLGAIALEALQQSPRGQSDLQELQRQMALIINKPVSATQVLTAAAWLYLIDAIELDQTGTIRRCN